MKRFISFILWMTILACSAFGQQVSFSVSVPSRVRQGEKFPITYRLKNAQGSSLRVADLEGCTLLYGPSVSTSHSTQIVNGQMSSSMTQDYTYYYRADKAGTIKVAEASISADGKTLRSNPTQITIVASSAGDSQDLNNSRQSARNSGVDWDDPTTQSSDRSVSANDVFVRIILSKSSAYEQEAIECEIKLYTKYGISSFIPTRQPAFDNFLIEELDISNQMNIEETYNGQRYMTALLKKCILFPQKTGKLNINSGNYDVTIIQYDAINMGLFSVQQPRERQIKISSNSVSVTINPLPEPRPAGFDGAVGSFTAESHLVGNNFKSGDPASIILTIKGTGNIKYLKEPSIDFPTQFEVYNPSSNINASVSGNNVSGSMTIDYTFVPQTSGNFTIPSLPFSYFNPSTGKYSTIELPSYTMNVAKGSVTAVASSDQKEIDITNQDIRYIRRADFRDLHRSHQPVFYSVGYWLTIMLPLCTLIIVVVVARRRIRLNSDIRGLRLAKANKVARRRLKIARDAMSAGNPERFYDEMLRAIWGYLSDKLSIPVSQLSRDNISDELNRHGFNENTIVRVIALIDDCEMAKYAPSRSDEQLDNMYKEGCDVIDSIEQKK